MEGWKEITIEDCCDILDNMRVPLNAQQREKIKGNIPYYGANGIQGYIDKYLFNEDLILIAEDGGNFEEYATKPIAYQISGKSWVNNHAHVLKVKNNFDHDFIFYTLVHKNILFFIKGGTRAKLNQTELRGIIINSPQSKTEQRKIAEVLSKVDKAIAQTEKLIAKYKRIKTGMMQDLLTKGIDENGNIRSEETHEFKDSSLGRIPVEWDFCNLGEKITLQRGFDITAKLMENGKVPVISSSGITGYHNKALVKGPGVITGRKGTLGKVHYIDVDYWPHDTTLWVRDFKGNNPLFISYILEKLNLKKFDAATANPTLNRNYIHPLKIIIPTNKEEQERIANLLNKAIQPIVQQTKAINKLRKLKTALMQDLLTGKVRVTDIKLIV
jgi:type I restriction enzyme S subunit